MTLTEALYRMANLGLFDLHCNSREKQYVFTEDDQAGIGGETLYCNFYQIQYTRQSSAFKSEIIELLTSSQITSCSLYFVSSADNPHHELAPETDTHIKERFSKLSEYHQHCLKTFTESNTEKSTYNYYFIIATRTGLSAQQAGKIEDFLHTKGCLLTPVTSAFEKTLATEITFKGDRDRQKKRRTSFSLQGDRVFTAIPSGHPVFTENHTFVTKLYYENNNDCLVFRTLSRLNIFDKQGDSRYLERLRNTYHSLYTLSGKADVCGNASARQTYCSLGAAMDGRLLPALGFFKESQDSAKEYLFSPVTADYTSDTQQPPVYPFRNATLNLSFIPLNARIVFITSTLTDQLRMTVLAIADLLLGQQYTLVSAGESNHSHISILDSLHKDYDISAGGPGSSHSILTIRTAVDYLHQTFDEATVSTIKACAGLSEHSATALLPFKFDADSDRIMMADSAGFSTQVLLLLVTLEFALFGKKTGLLINSPLILFDSRHQHWIITIIEEIAARQLPVIIYNINSTEYNNLGLGSCCADKLTIRLPQDPVDHDDTVLAELSASEHNNQIACEITDNTGRYLGYLPYDGIMAFYACYHPYGVDTVKQARYINPNLSETAILFSSIGEKRL